MFMSFCLAQLENVCLEKECFRQFISTEPSDPQYALQLRDFTSIFVGLIMVLKRPWKEVLNLSYIDFLWKLGKITVSRSSKNEDVRNVWKTEIFLSADFSENVFGASSYSWNSTQLKNPYSTLSWSQSKFASIELKTVTSLVLVTKVVSTWIGE